MERRRKSVELTREEYKALKSYCKGFRFITDAAEEIGISREVLSRVLAVRSGAPETIEAIKDAIAKLV